MLYKYTLAQDEVSPPGSTGFTLPDGSIVLEADEWPDGFGMAHSLLTDEEITLFVTSPINSQAYSDIVAIVPEWKQRNMIASAVNVLTNSMKRRGSLDADEEAELDALDAIWSQIVQIRTQSTTDAAAAVAAAIGERDA